MTNRRWPFVVSASVVAGTIGSLLFKRSNKKKKKDNISQYYIGSWVFGDEKRELKHSLSISPNLEFIVDETPLKGKTIELSKEKMVFRDEYGYHLTIKCQNKIPVSFYDEANDEEYPVMKKTTDNPND